MKHIGKTLALASAILTLGAVAPSVQAQGRGNFDPEQMRAQMMERMRERFEVKDDGEWKLIEERIVKVQDAQRAARSFAQAGGGFGGFGGGGRGQRGQQQDGNQGGGQRGGRGGFGAEPNADVEALQKAIENKASADELKPLLAKVREGRKQADNKLEAAQNELKKVLSVRQEAVAVMAGLVK